MLTADSGDIQLNIRDDCTGQDYMHHHHHHHQIIGVYIYIYTQLQITQLWDIMGIKIKTNENNQQITSRRKLSTDSALPDVDTLRWGNIKGRPRGNISGMVPS